MSIQIIHRFIGVSLMIIILILAGGSKGYGQPKKISAEQAWQIYHSMPSPQTKCDTASNLATTLFIYNQAEEARALLTDAISIAEKHGLEQQMTPLLFTLSRCDERDKKYTAAIANAQKALHLIKDDNNSMKGKLLSHLARYFQRSNNLPSMKEYYERAQQWNLEHEPYQNWILYEQMQEFYISIGDFDKTEETLMKAYELTRPVSNRMDHGLILYRFRQLASRKNDMVMFARYQKEYYKLTNENGGGKTIHGFDLGGSYSVDEAILKYKQLLVETEKIDFPEAKGNIYAQLVGLYIKKNEPESALFYQLKVDTTEGNLKFLEDYHGYFSQIYKMLGDYKKALNHAELFMARKNQLQEEDKQRQILALEAQYENDKKENEIKLLKLEDEAKSLHILKAEKEKWLLLLFSTLMMVLLSLVGYLFYQNRKKKEVLESKNKIISIALHEKDVLLREIHHRVKNNLQVVSSLLNLQSNYISDVVALEAINEGKNRVTSMALIHQNLYTEENLTSIDTHQYFDDLIDQLFESYQIDENKIRLEKSIDSILIDVDTMIPLGLITNELISNALKHAFHGKETGIISFSLKDKGDAIEVKIKDNGIGMLPEDFTSSLSFGNKMIHAFVQKLKAQLSINYIDGTEFTLTLNKQKMVKADRA